MEVDVIERKKTPTREDALASRLKSLREQNPSPHSASSSQPQLANKARTDSTTSTNLPKPAGSGSKSEPDHDYVEAAFQTDDQTLEELLGDIGPEDTFATSNTEPDDAKVKALLEQIAASIPKDKGTEADKDRHGSAENKESDDDSDGEDMQREVDSVIARFRDEIEVEAALSKNEPKEPSEPSQRDDDRLDSDEGGDEDSDQQPPPDLALPTVPTDDGLDASASPPAKTDLGATSLDDITARLSALRAPSSTDSASLDLPSVPTSKPAKPPRRLESKTNYTDEDVDSWCTVCLEDATLLCKGCSDEGDPYCVRCWREMHVGPAAAFDDRTHKAVQFSKKAKKDKDKEKKVAIGAS